MKKVHLKVHYKKVLGKKCYKQNYYKNSVIKKITDPGTCTYMQ